MQRRYWLRVSVLCVLVLVAVGQSGQMAEAHPIVRLGANLTPGQFSPTPNASGDVMYIVIDETGERQLHLRLRGAWQLAGESLTVFVGGIACRQIAHLDPMGDASLSLYAAQEYALLEVVPGAMVEAKTQDGRVVMAGRLG